MTRINSKNQVSAGPKVPLLIKDNHYEAFYEDKIVHNVLFAKLTNSFQQAQKNRIAKKKKVLKKNTIKTSPTVVIDGPLAFSTKTCIRHGVDQKTLISLNYSKNPKFSGDFGRMKKSLSNLKFEGKMVNKTCQSLILSKKKKSPLNIYYDGNGMWQNSDNNQKKEAIKHYLEFAGMRGSVLAITLPITSRQKWNCTIDPDEIMEDILNMAKKLGKEFRYTEDDLKVLNEVLDRSKLNTIKSLKDIKPSDLHNKPLYQRVYKNTNKGCPMLFLLYRVYDTKPKKSKVTKAEVTKAKVTKAKVTKAKVTKAKVTKAKVTKAKVTKAKTSPSKKVGVKEDKK